MVVKRGSTVFMNPVLATFLELRNLSTVNCKSLDTTKFEIAALRMPKFNIHVICSLAAHAQSGNFKLRCVKGLAIHCIYNCPRLSVRTHACAVAYAKGQRSLSPELFTVKLESQ